MTLGLRAERYLSYLKKETGLTFNDWKHRLNTQFSIRQLHESMLINQIPLCLGYGLLQRLFLKFKKIKGLIPSNYQQ